MCKLSQLETIAVKFKELLQKSGIEDQQQLLKMCRHRKERESLAQQTTINIKLITSWAIQADLVRINGIGMEYAELLEKCGVDSIQSLTQFNSEKLLATMQQVNEKIRLVQHLPNKTHIESWLMQAETLPPVLED